MRIVFLDSYLIRGDESFIASQTLTHGEEMTARQKKWFDILKILLLTPFLLSCTPPWIPDLPGDLAGGGGQDSVAVHMPMPSGTAMQCTQGVAGSYSHGASYTYYDVDFDTANGQDDYVFAPASGTVYVHDESRETGFGVHVNIDLDDGTYIVLGHLEEVFVADEEEIFTGQLLGFEGTTGYSSGDHIHMGRHDGYAWEDADQGESLEGLSFRTEEGVMPVTDMTCDLDYGHWYTSQLETVFWHPNGSLLKTPESADVYVLDNGALRLFENEEVFWSHGYDFQNISLVTQEEMDCYAMGEEMEEVSMQAVYDDGDIWFLVGDIDDENRYRQPVPSFAYSSVLESWGIMAESEYDFFSDEELGGILDDYPIVSEELAFRDGMLVKEEGDSTVYVISDGVAMPLEVWDVYLLLDFWNHDLIEVASGIISAVQQRVGDCETENYCITVDDLMQCGGSASYIPSSDDGEDSDSPGEGVDQEEDAQYTEDTGDAEEIVDEDGDGFSQEEDCNDTDDDINPHANEYCNGVDDDCDGVVDEEVEKIDLPCDESETDTAMDEADTAIKESASEDTDVADTDTEGIDGRSVDTDDSGEASVGILTLSWGMPGVVFDSIDLDGEYTFASGLTFGWQDLAEVEEASEVEYLVEGAASGDTLRFSVEFAMSGMVSWSCLAPFPPGTVQGDVVAMFDGSSLAVEAVEDPESDGCGLQVTIP